MKPAIFHDQAAAELDEAAAWYEWHSAGLGAKFRIAIEDAVQAVCRNPQLGSQYGSTRFRYALVRRFPYVVFYIDGDDTVEIMAVAHARRRPGYWKNRSDNLS